MKDPTGIIEQAVGLSQAVQEAQAMAEIRNAVKRHNERQAAYNAWIDPKAMAERKKANEETAAASLAYLRAVLPQEGEIPIPDPLPPEMVGQALSTIRRMLIQQRGVKSFVLNPEKRTDEEIRAMKQAAEEAQAKALDKSWESSAKYISYVAPETFTDPKQALKFETLKSWRERIKVKEGLDVPLPVTQAKPWHKRALAWIKSAF